MRGRIVVGAAAAIACCAALVPGAASAASAEDTLHAYQAVVDRDDADKVAALGVELDHTGFDAERRGAQRVLIDLFAFQAAELEADGVELTRVEAATLAPRRAKRTRSPGARVAKPETGGDSPNPFYDVFRTYSEPGGIADELAGLAQRYPNDAKLVRIGTSGRGKPILALKVTRDAPEVADGARPAVLYSGVNHAREWIAAETARRMPTWFLEHRDEPGTRELLDRAELWFLPIQNPDGYDYTFTCGVGDATPANVACGAALDPATGTYRYVDAGGTPQPSNNRLWRKTLRDNDANGVFGNAQDGVDPNRNYPTAWDLDQEGASNVPSSQVYRGPFPLSEPEDLAYDRLLRLITPEAVINYHSAAQLLLYPFGYITDVSSDDNPWFVALTGTDGDAAVDPYTSQRSSDLYVTNGETTDHAYNKYRSMAWTPELDECDTGGGATFCNGGSGFTFPDDEGKVEAVFEKNLDFARNVATTVTDRDRPDRPVNANEDQSSYRVKATPDIEADAFGVSYGNPQPVEANVRRILGPVDVTLEVADGPGGEGRDITLRMEEARGGERFGDLRGKYYHRMTVTPPADFVQPGTTDAPRPLVAGDVVEVTIRAGGQRQRFSYRVHSTRPAGDARRVLVVAAEDYRGVSPNRTPYASAPRYAGRYADSLRAAGHEVEVFDVDAPPAGPEGTQPSKYLSRLGVLRHFDAVVYETGDDLVPQDLSETVTESTYRRATGVGGTTTQTTAFAGSQHIARYGPRNWQALRDYLNAGGKLVVAGRNAFTPQLSTGTGLTSYSGYTWWQEPVFGFDYPANQGGDDDRPGSAYFRELDVSNDFGQYFLGLAGRQGGPFTTQIDTSAVAPAGTGGIFAGMAPVSVDASSSAGGASDPTQSPDGSAASAPKTPQRLRSLSSVTTQRAIRQERVELDYSGRTGDDGGAAISTADTVAFGFGLEQVGDAARDELLRRALAHLLPAAPDTTPPAATFLRPAPDATVTPRDPVEVEVDAADERGDLREVRLRAGGELVGTKVSFPFQLRWTPAPAQIGQSVTLTAEVEDRAGNVTVTERAVRVGPPDAGPDPAGAAAGPVAALGPPAPAAAARPAGSRRTTAARGKLRVSCRLVNRRRDLRCRVAAIRASRSEAVPVVRGKVRIAGRSGARSARGRGAVTVTIRGGRRALARGTRAVVEIRVGGATRTVTVTAGRTRTLRR
jgi:hypothetical protein